MAADYSFPFARVTISGKCIGGAEEWSTGFQFGREDADLTEIVSGGAELIAERWETFFTHASHGFSNSWYTEEVKIARILTNGKTDLDNIDYFTYPAPIYGAQGGQYMPPQITLAATLSSEYQRGLASKGRMYLPGLNLALDQVTGRIPNAALDTLATGFKAFLDGVNADDLGTGYIIIASKGHKTAQLDAEGQPVYENGRNAQVTGCRIGNVYDTQRRRRNSLQESYVTKVLA